MKNKIKQEIDKIEIPQDLSERSILGVNQGKSKTLFYLFFLILFVISFYLFKFIYQYLLPWNHYVFDIVYVLFYFIAIIPGMLFLAEKLVLVAISKGLGKSKNFKILLTIVFLVPTALLLSNWYIDNKEKNLDDVIDYHTADFDYVLIGDNWITDKKEFADELTTFLSHYRVKKMPDKEWDSDVSQERGFSITIYANGKPISASIYENRLLFCNSATYYKVLNGPIDMDRLKKLYEKYER